MRLAPRALLLAALGLSSGGCIENRLSVEIFTQVQGDGTCTRRIEYRLERVDTEKADARVAIPADQDPLLTLHRFPAGEPWRTSEDSQLGLHVLSVEAVGLASANAAEGDYWRVRSRRAQPARNSISAFADAEHGLYEYQEVLRDPASPLAGMRLLTRLAARQEGTFARQFAEALGERGVPPRETELRRLYREVFSTPFAQDVARVAERPFFGPRERRELDDVLERLDARQKQLVARVASLAAGTAASDVDAATDVAMKKLADLLIAEVEEAGVPLVAPEGAGRVRFRATLVMPVPILRANTCVSGDTAQWEFDENDLFGRGFEMKALAASR